MRKGILALIAYSIFNSVLFFVFGYNFGGKVKTEFYDTKKPEIDKVLNAGDTIITTGIYYVTEKGVGRSWAEADSGKYKSWMDVP